MTLHETTTGSATSTLGRPRRARVKRRGGGLLSIALLAAALNAGPAYAAENDAVRVWNERAAVTLANGNTAATPGMMFPPPVAFIHLAIVQAAVYDAVNAIKGGHDPYLKGLKAATSASQDAAAATAAHHVLIALVNQAPLTATLTADVKTAIKSRLDTEYTSSLAEIPAGQAKNKGVEVGAAAAAAMLANRAGDGRFGAPGFPVGSDPGEWRPVGGANDPNGWVRNVRPFALPSSEYFHTSGPPLPLTGAQYTAEFNEVKGLGRATGSTRTAAQTELAYFTAAHPVPMLYASMRQVAASKGLTISEQARFHAMTSMATADSAINCFAEKGRWNFWRPTTAIQLADTDGNPDTAPDTTWASLLGVPPYADEPSGANCAFSGLMNGAKAFFGSDQVPEFELVSPGPPGTTGLGSTRKYTSFSAVIADVIEARIYGGLHFRTADVNGADLGRRVAEFVDANFFNCRNRGQCKQEERE